MEIRCSRCGHLGAAGSIANTAAGVELICAHCGHANTLDVPKAPAKLAEVARQQTNDEWLSLDALQRLVPERGAGPRCQKCAALLDARGGTCARCGLNDEEAQRFAPGEAPWERPPAGKEDVTAQAMLLWGSVEENATDENLQKFHDFVIAEQLLELGIRRLKFFLVDHPGHVLATTHLQEVAQSFQAKAIVARAHAEVRADNIVATTARARQIVLWLVFLIFGGVFVIFLVGTMGGF